MQQRIATIKDIVIISQDFFFLCVYPLEVMFALSGRINGQGLIIIDKGMYTLGYRYHFSGFFRTCTLQKVHLL